jgi:hypothetical protein
MTLYLANESMGSPHPNEGRGNWLATTPPRLASAVGGSETFSALIPIRARWLNYRPALARSISLGNQGS